MARYSRIVRKRKKALPFLPVSWQAFIARRLIDVTGAGLLAGGLLFLAALASYSHTDPSWNTAGNSDDIANWLGLGGAYLSDLLLQTLGMGGAIPGVILTLWGLSILRRRAIAPLWLRLASALLATL